MTSERWTANEIAAATTYVREFGIGNISFRSPDAEGMEVGFFLGICVLFFRAENHVEIDEDRTPDSAMVAVLKEYRGWAEADFPV